MPVSTLSTMSVECAKAAEALPTYQKRKNTDVTFRNSHNLLDVT